jgi:hypothetical protein
MPEAKGLAIDMFQLKGMSDGRGRRRRTESSATTSSPNTITYDFTQEKLAWVPSEFDPPGHSHQ